jgi:putative membrane protein
MRMHTLLAAALLGAATPAAAQMMPNTMTTGRDFANTAASTDAYERAAARIAQESSRNPQVRMLAQMLEAAHTQSSKDLAMAADQAGVGRPKADLNPGQERMLEALRKAEGADFDKLYLQQQAQVHKEAKGLMETYARWGMEAPLRAAAAKTAPVVTQHLAQVTRLQHAM